MTDTTMRMKTANSACSHVAATTPVAAQAPCLKPADAARVVTIRTLRLGESASRNRAMNNAEDGKNDVDMMRSYFMTPCLASSWASPPAGAGGAASFSRNPGGSDDLDDRGLRGAFRMTTASTRDRRRTCPR